MDQRLNGWTGDDGEEPNGPEISLWEAELTALWEAEAAGRFVGFGRAGEDEEPPAPSQR
jgi:hypothetical protein